MHRRRATESKKSKLPRVISSFYSGFPDQVAHVRIDDAINATSRLRNAHAHRLGNFVFKCLQRPLFIEPHLSAQETVFIQITQNQIRIGNRNFRTSKTIANWSRVGSCTLGSDFEQSCFRIDPYDAATPGTDGLNPDLRQINLISKKDWLVVLFDQPVTNDTHLKGRSPHVRGKDMGDVQLFADKTTPHDAGGGARLDHTDGFSACILDP